MGIVKSVDRAEFDKQKRECLQVRACPYCGNKINLIMEFPTFEAEKAIFQCARCGHSLKEYIPVKYFECGESFGTFKTAECIGKAVLSLVDKWNTHAREISCNRSIPFKAHKKSYIYREIN